MNIEPSITNLEIGEINQWISLMGNPKNEILLILHGGPGLAGMPLYNTYFKKLAKNLLIVNWDQRGAGKSYNPWISKESMNLEQFINDGVELITYLIKKYKKEKIFLLGHSWGSALGILLCQKCPDLIHAYFGVGQIGNWSEGELISHNYILNKAREQNNNNILFKINKIGEPPYSWVNLILQRNLLLKVGGALHNQTSYRKLIPIYLKSKEYNIVDLIKYFLGIRFSLKFLWKKVTKLNLLQEVPEVKVPVCFLIGRHDYQVPFQCSEEYYSFLKAPEKKWYWFEKSGHTPMFEEVNKFCEIINKHTSTHNTKAS